MTAPISIVIPTLNAATVLPGTLAPLVAGVAEGIVRELVVSDGGSTDATCEVAEATGAVVVEGPAGRGGQLRRGAAAARGAWLLFLHADTHLSPDWVGAAAAHLSRPDTAGYFRLAFRADGLAPRVVAGWANLRADMLGLPYGDQGLLISRALYDHVGGYPDIPLMEDVALARALRGRLCRLPATAETSAARYEAEGWVHRGARNLSTVALYFAGRDPAQLVTRYARGPSSN